jgi:hypothetical protein
LHRRLPTPASVYSGLHVFVPLAWAAPGYCLAFMFTFLLE